MSAPRVEHRLARLAAKQYGVVGRAQLRTLGMSDDMIKRRVASGTLERCMPRVFRVAAAPETWHGKLLAVCLSIGDLVWVSHRAAAAFWGLDGFEEQIIEVTTLHRFRSSGVIVHRTKSFASYDGTVVRTVPVTTVHRTLIDLGKVAPTEHVELALECALRRRITTVERLLSRLRETEGRGHKGVAVLCDLLEGSPLRAAPTESALETRVLQLLRSHGLPDPVRQLVVRDEENFLARVDLAYPVARLIIEVDSRRHHTRRAEWERDLARRNELTSRGLLVLHVTDQKLKRGSAEFLECVRRTLGATVGQKWALCAHSAPTVEGGPGQRLPVEICSASCSRRPNLSINRP